MTRIGFEEYEKLGAGMEQVRSLVNGTASCISTTVLVLNGELRLELEKYGYDVFDLFTRNNTGSRGYCEVRGGMEEQLAMIVELYYL